MTYEDCIIDAVRSLNAEVASLWEELSERMNEPVCDLMKRYRVQFNFSDSRYDAFDNTFKETITATIVPIVTFEKEGSK